MRLNEITNRMKVWIIDCYGGKRRPATVIGFRTLRVNNRWLRYVSVRLHKQRNSKNNFGFNHYYYTDCWARNLRETSS